MAIKMQNRIDATFSATSMSDLVFLLLIFFMLTSTMVSPNAINLVLPKSDSDKQLVSKNVEVYINEDLMYFVNPEGLRPITHTSPYTAHPEKTASCKAISTCSIFLTPPAMCS